MKNHINEVHLNTPKISKNIVRPRAPRPLEAWNSLKMTEQSDPNESNAYFSEESILKNHINEVHLNKSYKCKKSKKHFLKTLFEDSYKFKPSKIKAL